MATTRGKVEMPCSCRWTKHSTPVTRKGCARPTRVYWDVALTKDSRVSGRRWQMIPTPHWTPTHREIARLDNAIDKVVVSDSLTTEQTQPWRDTTRIIRRADAKQ